MKEPSMPFAPVTAPIGYGDESIIHLDKHYTLQVVMQIQVIRVPAWEFILRVSSFLCTPFYDYNNKLLPSGEVNEVTGERPEVKKTSMGIHAKLEAQSISSSSLPRTLGVTQH